VRLACCTLVIRSFTPLFIIHQVHWGVFFAYFLFGNLLSTPMRVSDGVIRKKTFERLSKMHQVRMMSIDSTFNGIAESATFPLAFLVYSQGVVALFATVVGSAFAHLLLYLYYQRKILGL